MDKTKLIKLLFLALCCAYKIQAQQTPDSPDPRPFSSDPLYYQLKTLNFINNVRATHRAPPLMLNNTLNEMAMRCAFYYTTSGINPPCIYNQVPWSTPGDVAGDVLSGGPLDPAFARLTDEQFVDSSLQSWANEEALTDFTSNTGNFISGHFTQMVWKSSQLYGMALLTNNQYTIVVALFYPLGNIDGTFTENVLSPLPSSFSM